MPGVKGWRIGDRLTRSRNSAGTPHPLRPDGDVAKSAPGDVASGMEDGDFGIDTAVKTAVEEFGSLDYGFLIPFRKILSVAMLRKKAVRWVIGFGIFPLVLAFLNRKCEWSFQGSAWWIGGYFCLFWQRTFTVFSVPRVRSGNQAQKWAFFTIVVGLPLLFLAQKLPIIKTFYSGTESKSFPFRLTGFVLGVGILEETCKALPFFLFALRKKEIIPLKSGIFLGMIPVSVLLLRRPCSIP